MNPLENGTVIGKYLLLHRLDAGGMGDVWLARDTRLEREVALKFLGPHVASDSNMVKLLSEECMRAQRIKHPGVVGVFDFDCLEGRPFMSMEYIDGIALRDHLKSRPHFSLPWREALALGRRVAEVLHAMHGLGIIHRDVKPGNILLRGGRLDAPVLIDFGIAGQASRGSPEIGLLKGGTPGYMSPQQITNQAASRTDDMYSLGAVLFEMLAGQRVFSGEAEELVQQTVSKGADEVNVRLDLLHRERVPGALNDLVARLLNKNAQKRGADMGQIISEMKKLEADGASLRSRAAGPSAPPRTGSDEARTMLLSNSLAIPELPPPPPWPEVQENASMSSEPRPEVPLPGGLDPLDLAPEQDKPRSNGRFTLAVCVAIFAAAFAITLAVLPDRKQVKGADAVTPPANPATASTPVAEPPTELAHRKTFDNLAAEYEAVSIRYQKVDASFSDPMALQEAEKKAEAARELADQAVTPEQWAKAGEMMRGARDHLAAAEKEANKEMEKVLLIAAEKRAAEEARDMCEKARQEAEKGHAQRFAAGLFDRASEVQKEAVVEEQSTAYAKAAQAYTRAAGIYREAEDVVAAQAVANAARIDEWLEACETEKARDAFELISLVTPRHPHIPRWQARLAVNADVAGHLRAGDSHREQASWPMALVEYGQAADLDPDHLRARTLREAYNNEALNWLEREIHATHQARNGASAANIAPVTCAPAPTTFRFRLSPWKWTPVGRRMKSRTF
jgi:serine/threonine protein kinase